MTDAPNPAPEGQAEGQGTPWYKAEGFAPEIQGYVENKGWQDSPLKAITAYQHLEKFHGVPADQIIKLPKDFTNAEEMNPVYARLGRPDKPEGYKFSGEGLDPESLKWFSEKAHKLGLNNAQYNSFVSEFDSEQKKNAEEYQKALAQEETIQMDALKKEWGAGFDERSEMARRGMRSFLPKGTDEKTAGELMTAMERSIGTANFLKLFANIGEKVNTEDKIHQGDSSRKFGYTKEQALDDVKTLMAEIKADPARLANFNKNVGPDVEKLARLNKLAYPAAA